MMPDARLLTTLVSTTAYVVLGLLMFALSFRVLEALSPFSIRKEIEEDQNTAVAILIAATFLGTAQIIAAAIHG